MTGGEVSATSIFHLSRQEHRGPTRSTCRGTQDPLCVSSLKTSPPMVFHCLSRARHAGLCSSGRREGRHGPNPRVFDARELLTINRVYEAAWAELDAHDPLPNKLKDDERRRALRKRVCNLAHSRKVEFGTLYQMVLTTIPRNWTTTNGGHSSHIGHGQRSDAARDTNKVRE